MQITLNLPSDTLKRLIDIAEQKGTSLDALVVTVLEAHVAQKKVTPTHTQILDALGRGMGVSEVARIYSINRSTVYRAMNKG